MGRRRGRGGRKGEPHIPPQNTSPKNLVIKMQTSTKIRDPLGFFHDPMYPFKRI
jgi:hypothetical protein